MKFMNETAKVFVLNYAGHNLEDAEKYGKLIHLTLGNLSFDDTDRIRFNIDLSLRQNCFDAEKDYVLLSGSVVLGYLLGRILQHKDVKLLIWDAKNRKYIIRNDTNLG